jgi:hypothetical protein
MDGPKLRLIPASAQAIGLALHELAANAGKYGSLSVGGGRVEIGWGTDGDTFTMSWVERDGRRVSAPKRQGFGTIVLQAMAESSVNGTVDLDYAPSGVTWRLTCPATNALAPNGDTQSNMGPSVNQKLTPLQKDRGTEMRWRSPRHGPRESRSKSSISAVA